jgi:hypothetical protein
MPEKESKRMGSRMGGGRYGNARMQIMQGTYSEFCLPGVSWEKHIRMAPIADEGDVREGE